MRAAATVHLAALHAGYETGWWDHTGVPAPWPDDIDDPDSDCHPHDNNTEPQNEAEPPF